MKKIVSRYFLFAALLAAALQSCSVKENSPWENNGEEYGVALSFSTGGSFDVKSPTTRPGEDPYNENRLASVEYFLYPDGKTNQDAVLHGYLTGVRANIAYTVPMTEVFVANTLCPGNSKQFYVYAIANLDRIVDEAAPGYPEDLSGTSVAELEALTTRIEYKEGSSTEIAPIQEHFLMATDGPTLVTGVKRRNTTIANATLALKRTAAKISAVVRVAENVVIENKIIVSGVEINRTETWEPDVENMTLYLVNGNKVARVSGVPVDTPENFDYQAFGFDTQNGETHTFYEYEALTNDDGDFIDEHGDVIGEDDDKVFVETQRTGVFHPCAAPFYTEPYTWEYGSKTEPYLKLTIPWNRLADPVQNIGPLQKLYYYRIYCPGTVGRSAEYDAEFLRNNWYKIILNVSILGSETDGGELIINGDYYVVDWQEREEGGSGSGSSGTTINDSDKDAEIKGARYLFVNKEEYFMYNVNDLSIPYVTSDPCEIVDFECTRFIFSGATKTEETITNPAFWDIDLNLRTTATGAHIIFGHELNNDTSNADYDVSPYEITFTLRQKSDHSYQKHITIHQYPAIKIDLENNDGNSSNGHGHTYVNNGVNLTYVGNTNGTSSGNNTNFNMVIIETTVLPADSEFLLGDPRSMTVDNIFYPERLRNGNQRDFDANYETWPGNVAQYGSNTNNHWSANTTSIQSNTRRLSWYYPVSRENEANNIIAPKFRVASSHGATNSLTYANAFRRCASYQEAGYPAGRWRLPTVAEVTYAMKLNADGKITRLFGSTNNGETSDYWCNSGYITVYDGTNEASKQPPVPHPGVTNQSSVYVRCVYDDWYWDGKKLNNVDVSKVAVGTFTWGDMPR